MTKIWKYVEMTPFWYQIMLKMKPIMLNYDGFMLKIVQIMLNLNMDLEAKLGHIQSIHVDFGWHKTEFFGINRYQFVTLVKQ